MSYKIAIASSDQANIDLNFGSAVEFLIYEVSDDGAFGFLERRAVSETAPLGAVLACSDKGECKGGGCHGSGPSNPRVDSIADCRCVLSKKTGTPILKQLDKKAISSFEIEGDIYEALQKITLYFHRVDHHQTLRGIANVR